MKITISKRDQSKKEMAGPLADFIFSLKYFKLNGLKRAFNNEEFEEGEQNRTEAKHMVVATPFQCDLTKHQKEQNIL